MREQDEHVLRLEPELTIYGAAALRERLLDAFGAAGGALALDLADVCDIDSAGLQVLMAARRDADARGLALRFTNHGAGVLEAFALFGLTDQGRAQPENHHGT